MNAQTTDVQSVCGIVQSHREPYSRFNVERHFLTDACPFVFNDGHNLFATAIVVGSRVITIERDDVFF